MDQKQQVQPNQQKSISLSQSSVEKDEISQQSSSKSLSASDNQNIEEKIEDKPPGQNGQRKRYKYCCKKCKHTDKHKKACVCVVPMSQRRTQLGDIGCQTCGCFGCSKQDYISRGQDPQYKPGQKKIQKQFEFQARNGCCRKCMKAFSKSHKACLCQVPQTVRKGKLPSSGCKICGCRGCNPEDKKDVKDRKTLKSKSRSRQRTKKHKSRRKSHYRSSSIRSIQKIDPIAMNFYNIDRSIIGNMISQDYQLTPLIFGFGVPQRSQSYIIGRPK